MINMKTKERKELKIRTAKESSLSEVYFENGGELPVELTGYFTSTTEAQRAIDTYNLKRDKKEAVKEE